MLLCLLLPTATSCKKEKGDLQTVTTKEFNENNIVLSFGAISDIHITGNEADDSEEKFRAAVTQLKRKAAEHDANGLDAIAIAGDIADNGTETQVNTFAALVKSMGVKNVMLTPGNHDLGNAAATMTGYLSALGEEYVATDADRTMIDKGALHCVVGGSHFILIEPSSYSNNCPYDTAVVDWLDATLADITENTPNAYVFLFTHPMIYDTCYGSTLSGGFWYTSYLAKTLSKYPQVITFGGHLHFPINDERTIMQTDFTSVGCGAVRYLATERGYSNMASATVPKDAYSVSAGLLVQVDHNGNIRITRMDFSNHSTFKEPWELPYPDADKEHLKTYTKERGAVNLPPVLLGKPVLHAEISPETGVVTKCSLKITAGADDDMVHHYKVVIENLLTNASSTFYFLSDFYRHAQPTGMAKELVFPIDINEAGFYRIEVCALDSWDAESEKISCVAVVGNSDG